MDHNIDAHLDLTRDTLLKACKGDVSKLPRFCVHTVDSWPHSKVRTDKLGRLHMNSQVFLRQIADALPVKPGLWHPSGTMQEFYLDLQPHHLDGSSDTKSPDKTHKHVHALAKADAAGRFPDEPDYQDAIAPTDRQRDATNDLADLKTRGEGKSVRSSVFAGNSNVH